MATARHYAGENALVVVTGRENIAGLQLNGTPFLRDKGVAILALNNQGYPSLCWSTGPGFSIDLSNDSVKTRKTASPTQATPGILSQPSAFKLPQGVPVAGDVLATGIGLGSERIHGFMDLTEIHRIIKDSL